MSVCPACNGISDIKIPCPLCANVLFDKGSMESYFDPYSPYLDEEILDMVDGVDSEFVCVHIFYCPNCNIHLRKEVHTIQ